MGRQRTDKQATQHGQTAENKEERSKWGKIQTSKRGKMQTYGKVKCTEWEQTAAKHSPAMGTLMDLVLVGCSGKGTMRRAKDGTSQWLPG